MKTYRIINAGLGLGWLEDLGRRESVTQSPVRNLAGDSVSRDCNTKWGFRQMGRFQVYTVHIFLAPGT